MERTYRPVGKYIFLQEAKDFLNRVKPFDFTPITKEDIKDVRIGYTVIAPLSACSSLYPQGAQELVEGFHIYWITATSKGVLPVAIALYWDGIQIRAYIPTDGNTWNKSEYCAYGFELLNTTVISDIDLNEELNLNDMIMDVMNNILLYEDDSIQ